MTTAAVSARALLDDARSAFGVRTLYAVAKRIGLPSDYLYKYYRKDNIPLPARNLICAKIADARK